EGGLTGLAFADPGLDRAYGFQGGRGEEVVHQAEVTIPLRLAADVAKALRNTEVAEGEDGDLLEALEARGRVSHLVHGYLPEALRGRLWRTFEIAPGISAERDYGSACAEFDVGKFAGVEFDAPTREAVAAATAGLKAFLLNLVSDPDYDFTEDAANTPLGQPAPPP